MVDPAFASDEHRALQKRNRELSILNSIAQALHREVDLARALQVVLAQVADLFGLRTGWIYLVDNEQGRRNDTDEETYLAASHNLPTGLIDEPALMAGSCYCLDTFQSGDLDGAANVNIITCSRLRKLVSGTEGLRFHASIPLYAQERKLGVLNVASTDWNELSEDDLCLLYTVGDLLSIAIERAQLFERSAHFGAIEERNRLAREIHDTLAQGFSGIALQLETADALLEKSADDGAARRFVQQALAVARTSLDEARRSVLDLRAAPLEGRTLAQALSLLVGTHQGKKAALQFVQQGADRPLPKQIEAGLYRIAQEALQNACRHADAAQIKLVFALNPNEVLLEIIDDGNGFLPEEADKERFGLLGMNERARLLGGQLTIESDAQRGSRISVCVPVAQVHIEDKR